MKKNKISWHKNPNLLLIIVLLVDIIFFGILLFNYLSDLFKPEFTITKNECSNVTNYDYLEGCTNSCAYMYLQLGNTLNFSSGKEVSTAIQGVIDCLDYCENNSVEEVCEEIEVDKSLCYDYNIGEIRSCESWEYRSITNIEKIKISSEWLSVNCECINCIGVGNEMVVNEEGKLINKEMGPLCCGKNNNACIKKSYCKSYKCGDYTLVII